MADSKPINWAYPFKTAETSANPLQYLTHMAKANDGFYPTGENGLWHGGVHFDNGTAAVFDQSSVRCIADGEVIAYRVNETYPISEYTESVPQIKRVPYSSGFVLVKHMLRPPQPTNGAAAASEQSPPTLTFYSLYMHLQDWAGYQVKADLPRPGFWEAASYIVNTKDQGLNVRAAPNTNGTALGMLSKGAQITVGSPEGDFCKLLSILSGSANPTLTPDSEGKLPGYVSFKLLKAQHEPKAKDRVVVLPPGIAIKAGDLIGHLGTYQNHNGAAQPLLHLEVFSCEDVPGFISKSQAWARSLPDTEKSLLKVHKDASRLITHRDDIKADNPPKQSDAGNQIGVDLVIPQALLDGLPAASKIKVSTTVAGSNTPQITQWWRLDGLFADKEGNPINGWLAEQDLITTRHSPWEWTDVHCIEDTGKPVEKLAYIFNARGMLSDEEKQNYRTHISKADGGPILAIARLYDIVDTDQDGVLTRKEIRTALSKPWHAQVLGQLITKYESEWFWDKSKWNELDPLLEEEPGKPNQTWEVEKQRIEKLSWWKELVGPHGISGDGKAWHFQPMAFVNQFFSGDVSDCGCKLGKIFSCVRFKGQTTIYGPLYSGLISLDKYKKWDETTATGIITEEDKKIFIAISPNEGNIDAIQSYDSEILTVGAMQKTINPSGAGEFPIQVFDFKERYPHLYTSLFENCGWTVKGPRARAKMYYKNSTLTEGNEYTGAELKKLIRKDFSEAIFTQKQKVESFPLGAILNAITHEKFQEQQILDFSKRMRSEVLEIKPSGSEYKLKDFLKSPLGKATALDHHINRPGYVSTDFGAALKRFFDKNPSISKSPANWGDKHAVYELEILEDYGKARRMAIVHGTSVAPSRYQHLKEKL
ncbi:SH3 domain-containing protein [Pseudomonas sp. CrR25]|nr:SH3 domain-containing protein [Pseudomonas sp. CrR25]